MKHQTHRVWFYKHPSLQQVDAADESVEGK